MGIITNYQSGCQEPFQVGHRYLLLGQLPTFQNITGEGREGIYGRGMIKKPGRRVIAAGYVSLWQTSDGE